MKSHREERGWYQDELARMLNVDPALISKWERLVLQIPAERALQLEQVFDCRAEDLILDIAGGVEALDKAREEGRPSRLKLYCNKHKITALQLVSLSGMSITAISNYFRGTIPPPKTQKRIADALGVTRGELFPSDIERFGK